MMRIRGSICLLGLCLAAHAAAPAAPFGGQSSGPLSAPLLDVAGGTLFVGETDLAGKPVHRTSFILTDLPAKTCLGDGWKQVVVLDNGDGFVADPAYKQTGGTIEILLVGNICDAYSAYVGELRDGAFRGEHVHYGRGPRRSVGQVTGWFMRAGG